MKPANVALLIICIIASGCKKHSPPQPIDYTPDKAVLLSPSNDEACYAGIIMSATQSKVTFNWNSAPNATTYKLTVKNLETGEIVSPPATSNFQLDVTISPNAPYSWFVISQSDKSSATAKSDTWKFYNSGPADTSHAPFPAEIVLPLFNQNIEAISGKITLSWTGTDVDNDIVGYDLYFGQTNPLQLKQPNLVANTFTVDVSSKTTYYWKVVTKDSKKNTSDSGLYQFTVE